MSDTDSGQVAAGSIAGSATQNATGSGRIVAVPNVMGDESKPNASPDPHAAPMPPAAMPRQPDAAAAVQTPPAAVPRQAQAAVVQAPPVAAPRQPDAAVAQAAQGNTARKQTLAKTTPAAVPPPRGDHNDDAHYHGDNSVAAAMTEALVKQSAQLDPSLPPPTNMPARDAFAEHTGPTRDGANAVAAAMTAELVRQSSKVNTPSQPPAQTGTHQ
ncbi:MAG TPA: hypothetical protein VNE00_20785 [Paraburkholderia sp.]|nr:hypothetical protein [Paraburkholderia sp.]